MPRGIYRNFLCLALCLLAACVHAQEGARFWLLEDSSGTMTPATALRQWQEGKFTLVTGGRNIGFTRSVFWLACSPDSGTHLSDPVLTVGDPHINRLHFYESGSATPRYITGDYYPFRQRPVESNEFVFPVQAGRSYLLRIDKAHESLQLSFAVKDKLAVIRDDARNTLVFALFTGGLLLLVFFGSYLLLLSGDRIYLFYIVYIITGWCWVLANSGLAFHFLWPEQTWFASKSRPVFALATAALSIHFMMHYINAEKQRWLHRFVRGMSIFLGSSIVFVLLLNGQGYRENWWVNLQKALPVVMVLYVLVALGSLVQQTLKRNRLALFYLVAILALMVFALLQVAFYSGTLEGSPFLGRYGMATGYVVEAVVLTAGLTYRFNQYKRDREHLLLELNRRQAENTRILMEVQEAERSQVANQLHDVAGSLLSAAKLNISSLREQAERDRQPIDARLLHTEAAISEVADKVRNLSHALSPVMLAQVGFPKAMEKVVALFNASGRIRVELLVSGFESYDPALSVYYSAFYGIVHELVNNILKHSGATEALVQLAEMDDCFTLIVEDNGTGFDPGVPSGSLGLAGVYSKIDYFKGRIAIERNQPSGTLITIEIPRT
jgi:two-component system, sensor histidine kinase LadS